MMRRRSVSASWFLPIPSTILLAVSRLSSASRACSSSSSLIASSSSSSSSSSLVFASPESLPPHAELNRVALDELRLEIERDRDQNAIGNAPMPPKGWSVTHTPGTSTFQVSTKLAFKNSGGTKKSRGDNNRQGRWNAKVDIFCRFESIDPSFHDSTVDLSEYVPFRVEIERTSGDDYRDGMSAASTTPPPATSLKLVVDCASTHLAQLRVRRMFFAPNNEHPELKEVMLREAQTGTPHSVFVGPNFGTLSKELNVAAHEFLSGCGVDNRMAEFVCQMAYYLEHEEYQLWLARLAKFAESSSN